MSTHRIGTSEQAAEESCPSGLCTHRNTTKSVGVRSPQGPQVGPVYSLLEAARTVLGVPGSLGQQW